MTHENGDPHTSRGDFNSRVQNFLGLCHHLPLFFRASIFHENIDVRDHVKGDLLGKFLRLNFVDRIVDCLCLIPKFVHAFFTRTRCRLICAYDNAFNFCAIVQRLQRDNHLRC